jgi:hypothetical protein
MMSMEYGGQNRGSSAANNRFRFLASEMIKVDSIAEPSFKAMKAIPAAAAFISQLKSKPILRGYAKTSAEMVNDEIMLRKIEHHQYASMVYACDPKMVEQKIVLILDKDLKQLGVIRWIRGQGEPFFYRTDESVQSVIESAEAKIKKTITETPYVVNVSEARRGGEFRIMDDNAISLEKALDEILAVIPNMSVWDVKSKFEALRALPEAREFISSFKELKLRLELVGRMEYGFLNEAAVYIMTESNQAVAMMKWVFNEGGPVFQNMLVDASQSVNTVLGSLSAPQPQDSERSTPVRAKA